MSSFQEAIILAKAIAESSSLEDALHNASILCPSVSREIVRAAWEDKPHHDKLLQESAMASAIRDKLAQLEREMGEDTCTSPKPGAPADIVLPPTVPSTLSVHTAFDILHQLLDDLNREIRRYRVDEGGVQTSFSASPVLRSARVIDAIDDMVTGMIKYWASSTDAKGDAAELFVQCVYAYWLPMYTFGKVSSQPGWRAHRDHVFDRLSG